MTDYDVLVNNNYNFFEKIAKLKPYSTKTLVTFFDLKNDKIIEMKNVYDHIEYLQKNFHWVKREINDMEEVIDAEMDDFESNIEPEEHPAWHNFEIYVDDMRSDTYKEIYQEVAKKERLYRVGFFRKRMDVGPVEASMDSKDRKTFEQIAEDFKLKISFT